MKFLVLFACIAVASAQLVAYPNGAVVPVDEPAVQAARADHLAAHGLPVAAYAYAGYPYAYNFGLQYAGGLVAHPNGAVVPVDEPAVQAARAAHFAAAGIPIHPYAYAAGYTGLVAHPNGAIVPVEPADVIAARAEHLAAHAAA